MPILGALGGLAPRVSGFGRPSATASDPLWAQVQLLLQCEGSNGSTAIVDSSSFARTITANNGAALSTADQPFGTAALLLDGINDFLEVPRIDFGTGPFTIEWFAKKTANGAGSFAGYDGVFDNSRGNGTGDAVLIETSTSRGYFYAPNGISSSGTNPNGGTWKHWAVCRDASNNVRLFYDGAQVASGTDSNNKNTSNTILIGAQATAGQYAFSGRMKCIRITTAARYTSAFTPPSGLFPTS